MTKKLEIAINDDFIDAVAERVRQKNKAEAEAKAEAEKQNTKEYYKVKEICELLQISNLTVRNHIKLGYLKASKVGKSFHIHAEDLEEYINRPKKTEYVQ